LSARGDDDGAASSVLRALSSRVDELAAGATVTKPESLFPRLPDEA